MFCHRKRKLSEFCETLNYNIQRSFSIMTYRKIHIIFSCYMMRKKKWHCGEYVAECQLHHNFYVLF